MASIMLLYNSLDLSISVHLVAMSVQVYYFSTILSMKISLLDDNIGIPECDSFLQ